MDDSTTCDGSPRLLSEAEFIGLLRGETGSPDITPAEAKAFGVSRDGKLYYPSFLADTTLKRSDLRAVERLLEGLSNFTKWQFFISGKGSLGGLTPLQALRQGKLRQVKVTAEGFAER